MAENTIRDNICYGNESASETEIMKVSREANIDEFISNLPDAYQIVFGDKGCQLSGGQWQRIAIARTRLKRPAMKQQVSSMLNLRNLCFIAISSLALVISDWVLHSQISQQFHLIVLDCINLNSNSGLLEIVN
ncbi:hypothetical protein ACLB2K_070591 [Fragaria x ananassa]